MMSTPFLTLAIPTYNRRRWIERSLSAAIREVRAVPQAEIEIVVSDNCSTDGTWPFLESVAREAPFLRLNRNETNRGAEGNIVLLPGLARGRYLYMMGDDDVLEPGSIARILEELKHEPDYVVVNFSVYDHALETCLHPNGLHVGAPREFRTQAECLAAIDPMNMTFISLWVARREFFNVISEETFRRFQRWSISIQLDRYFGTAKFTNGRLIPEPLFRARRAVDPGYDAFSAFFEGSAEVFRYASEHGALSPGVIEPRKTWLLRNIAVKRILFERWEGTFDRARTYRILRDDYAAHWEFWLLCLPAMLIPGLGAAAGLVQRLRGRPLPPRRLAGTRADA